MNATNDPCDPPLTAPSGGEAYPRVRGKVPPNVSSTGGLTIRAHFAGLAMQGLLAHRGRYWQCEGVGNPSENIGGLLPSEAAKSALEYADALILELSKP